MQCPRGDIFYNWTLIVYVGFFRTFIFPGNVYACLWGRVENLSFSHYGSSESFQAQGGKCSQWLMAKGVEGLDTITVPGLGPHGCAGNHGPDPLVLRWPPRK